MKRSLALTALCASTLLAGCKEPPAGPDSKNVSTFIRAGQGVEIKEMRTFATSDAVAGSNDEYYVIRFNWTNDLGVPVVPQIDHFVIEDNDKRRYLGVTSGSAALVGISNFSGQLERGQSHEYTVGFRVPIGTQGLLFYDSSF